MSTFENRVRKEQEGERGREYSDRMALLMSDLLKSFVETNAHRRKHYSLKDIFTVYHKTVFTYTHVDAPYLATIKRVYGPERAWLQVSLGHKDFTPMPAAAFPRPDRPASNTELPTSTRYVTGVPELAELLQTHFDEYSVQYNVQRERLEVRFYPIRGHAIEGLVVTLSQTFPYIDHPRTTPIRAAQQDDIPM